MIDNLLGEEWRDIECYEGLYQVSNLGRIKSLNYKHTCTERILKPRKCGSKLKHYNVHLCNNGIVKQMLVHRLVATAFIPNPENKPEVDHIDTDRTNNCVDNLRWVTSKENNNNKLTLIHFRDAKRTKMIPIYCLETDKNYESANEAERQLNVHHSSILRCCKGERNHAGGYHFCYASDIKKED